MNQEYLKQRVHYDPETGIFTWLSCDNRSPSWNTRYAGKIAGSIGAGGYFHIGIDYIGYRSHRLAWLYMYGEWPRVLIDHVNGVRTDNRISNLRLASYSQNQVNRGAHSNNKLGIKGVSYSEKDRRYCARIRVNNHSRFLGWFKTIEEASAAYAMASKELHGEFGRAA